MIVSEKKTYQDDGVTFEGLVAYDTTTKLPAPILLVVPTIRGRTGFENNRAIALAKLGYVGFAVDLYGKDRQSDTLEQARILMQQLNLNRSLLLRRMELAVETAKTIPQGDRDRLGAIGFCFGGKCVLDLARSGENIAGVASFHGVYDAPREMPSHRIQSPVLLLHGWEDPLAKPSDLSELAEELTAKGANWELHAYGHTGHAFTNPSANRPEDGMAYNDSANRKSWEIMLRFFEENFNRQGD